MTLSDEQLRVIKENWQPILQGIGEWFQQVSKTVQGLWTNWLPIVSELQRAEAKRVHTAYRVRQKARRRRRRG